MEQEYKTSKFKPWFKVVSLVVVAAFMWEQIVYAQGGTPVFLAQKVSGKLTQKDLEEFNIPQDVGITRKIHKGEDDKTIIHIQDAHDSLTAQESIVKILENLLTNYNVRLIAEEGAAGYIDTSILSSFPIEDIKQKTSRQFMEQGRLSAAEFFTICSKESIGLYGIEDNELYTKDLAVYRDMLLNNREVVKQAKALKDALEALQPRIYTPDMIELTKNSVLHKGGKLAFSKHWEYISNLGNKTGVKSTDYPNINLLLTALSLEKQIDFAAADKEKDAAVQLITQKLDKASLEKFLLKALAFKAKKITNADFYSYLEESAQKANIDLKQFKNLYKYYRYVELYESIDIAAIFKEVSSFEEAIKEKLFTSNAQRDLYKYTKYANYLKMLLDGILSEEDYKALLELNPQVNIRDLSTFLKSSYDKYGLILRGDFDLNAISQKIPRSLSFYDTASKRNTAMINNTIKTMKQNNQTVAALITGGFHTEGLTELLKTNKLSYLVIMPKINGNNKPRPYITVITDKRSPYEKMLASGNYQISAGVFLRDIEDIKAQMLAMLTEASQRGERLEKVIEDWKAQRQEATRTTIWHIDTSRLSDENFNTALVEVMDKIQPKELAPAKRPATRRQTTKEPAAPAVNQEEKIQAMVGLLNNAGFLRRLYGRAVSAGDWNDEAFVGLLRANGYSDNGVAVSSRLTIKIAEVRTQLMAAATQVAHVNTNLDRWLQGEDPADLTQRITAIEKTKESLQPIARGIVEEAQREPLAKLRHRRLVLAVGNEEEAVRIERMAVADKTAQAEPAAASRPAVEPPAVSAPSSKAAGQDIVETGRLVAAATHGLGGPANEAPSAVAIARKADVAQTILVSLGMFRIQFMRDALGIEGTGWKAKAKIMLINARARIGLQPDSAEFYLSEIHKYVELLGTASNETDDEKFREILFGFYVLCNNIAGFCGQKLVNKSLEAKSKELAMYAVKHLPTAPQAQKEPSPFMGATGPAMYVVDGKVHVNKTLLKKARVSGDFRKWNRTHEKAHIDLDKKYGATPVAARELAAIALAFKGLSGITDPNLRMLLRVIGPNFINGPPQDLSDRSFLEGIATYLTVISDAETNIPIFRGQILTDDGKIRDEVIHGAIRIIQEETKFTPAERRARLIKRLEAGEELSVNSAREILKNIGLRGEFSYSTVAQDLREIVAESNGRIKRSEKRSKKAGEEASCYHYAKVVVAAPAPAPQPKQPSISEQLDVVNGNIAELENKHRALVRQEEKADRRLRDARRRASARGARPSIPARGGYVAQRAKVERELSRSQKELDLVRAEINGVCARLERLSGQRAQLEARLIEGASAARQLDFFAAVSEQYQRRFQGAPVKSREELAKRIDMLFALAVEGLAVCMAQDLRGPRLKDIVTFIQEKAREVYPGKLSAREIERINAMVVGRVNYFLSNEEGLGKLRQIANGYMHTAQGRPLLGEVLTATLLVDIMMAVPEDERPQRRAALAGQLSNERLEGLTDSVIDTALATLRVEWEAATGQEGPIINSRDRLHGCGESLSAKLNELIDGIASVCPEYQLPVDLQVLVPEVPRSKIRSELMKAGLRAVAASMFVLIISCEPQKTGEVKAPVSQGVEATVKAPAAPAPAQAQQPAAAAKRPLHAVRMSNTLTMFEQRFAPSRASARALSRNKVAINQNAQAEAAVMAAAQSLYTNPDLAAYRGLLGGIDCIVHTDQDARGGAAVWINVNGKNVRVAVMDNGFINGTRVPFNSNVPQDTAFNRALIALVQQAVILQGETPQKSYEIAARLMQALGFPASESGRMKWIADNLTAKNAENQAYACFGQRDGAFNPVNAAQPFVWALEALKKAAPDIDGEPLYRISNFNSKTKSGIPASYDIVFMVKTRDGKRAFYTVTVEIIVQDVKDIDGKVARREVALRRTVVRKATGHETRGLTPEGKAHHLLNLKKNEGDIDRIDTIRRHAQANAQAALDRELKKGSPDAKKIQMLEQLISLLEHLDIWWGVDLFVDFTASGERPIGMFTDEFGRIHISLAASNNVRRAAVELARQKLSPFMDSNSIEGYLIDIFAPILGPQLRILESQRDEIMAVLELAEKKLRRNRPLVEKGALSFLEYRLSEVLNRQRLVYRWYSKITDLLVKYNTAVHLGDEVDEAAFWNDFRAALFTQIDEEISYIKDQIARLDQMMRIERTPAGTKWDLNIMLAEKAKAEILIQQLEYQKKIYADLALLGSHLPLPSGVTASENILDVRRLFAPIPNPEESTLLYGWQAKMSEIMDRLFKKGEGNTRAFWADTMKLLSKMFSGQTNDFVSMRLRENIIKALGCQHAILEANIQRWQSHIEILSALKIKGTGVVSGDELENIPQYEANIRAARQEQAAILAQQNLLRTSGNNTAEIIETSGRQMQALQGQADTTRDIAARKRAGRDRLAQARAVSQEEAVATQVAAEQTQLAAQRVLYAAATQRALIDAGLVPFMPVTDENQRGIDERFPLPGMPEEAAALTITTIKSIQEIMSREGVPPTYPPSAGILLEYAAQFQSAPIKESAQPAVPLTTPGGTRMSFSSFAEAVIPGFPEKPVGEKLKQIQAALMAMDENWDKTVEVNIGSLEQSIRGIRDRYDRAKRLWDKGTGAISGWDWMDTQDELSQAQILEDIIKVYRRQLLIRKAKTQEEFNRLYSGRVDVNGKNDASGYTYEELVIRTLKSALERTNRHLRDLNGKRGNMLSGNKKAKTAVFPAEEIENVEGEIGIASARVRGLQATIEYFEMRRSLGLSIAPTSAVVEPPSVNALSKKDPRTLPQAGVIGSAVVVSDGEAVKKPVFAIGSGYATAATTDEFRGSREQFAESIDYQPTKKDEARQNEAYVPPEVLVAEDMVINGRPCRVYRKMLKISRPTYATITSGAALIDAMEGAVVVDRDEQPRKLGQDPVNPDFDIVGQTAYEVQNIEGENYLVPSGLVVRKANKPPIGATGYVFAPDIGSEPTSDGQSYGTFRGDGDVVEELGPDNKQTVRVAPGTNKEGLPHWTVTVEGVVKEAVQQKRRSRPEFKAKPSEQQPAAPSPGERGQRPSRARAGIAANPMVPVMAVLSGIVLVLCSAVTLGGAMIGLGVVAGGVMAIDKQREARAKKTALTAVSPKAKGVTRREALKAGAVTVGAVAVGLAPSQVMSQDTQAQPLQDMPDALPMRASDKNQFICATPQTPNGTVVKTKSGAEVPVVSHEIITPTPVQGRFLSRRKPGSAGEQFLREADRHFKEISQRFGLGDVRVPADPAQAQSWTNGKFGRSRKASREHYGRDTQDKVIIRAPWTMGEEVGKRLSLWETFMVSLRSRAEYVGEGASVRPSAEDPHSRCYLDAAGLASLSKEDTESEWQKRLEIAQKHGVEVVPLITGVPLMAKSPTTAIFYVNKLLEAGFVRKTDGRKNKIAIDINPEGLSSYQQSRDIDQRAAYWQNVLEIAKEALKRIDRPFKEATDTEVREAEVTIFVTPEFLRLVKAGKLKLPTRNGQGLHFEIRTEAVGPEYSGAPVFSPAEDVFGAEGALSGATWGLVGNFGYRSPSAPQEARRASFWRREGEAERVAGEIFGRYDNDNSFSGLCADFEDPWETIHYFRDGTSEADEAADSVAFQERAEYKVKTQAAWRMQDLGNFMRFLMGHVKIKPSHYRAVETRPSEQAMQDWFNTQVLQRAVSGAYGGRAMLENARTIYRSVLYTMLYGELKFVASFDMWPLGPDLGGILRGLSEAHSRLYGKEARIVAVGRWVVDPSYDETAQLTDEQGNVVGTVRGRLITQESRANILLSPDDPAYDDSTDIISSSGYNVHYVLTVENSSDKPVKGNFVVNFHQGHYIEPVQIESRVFEVPPAADGQNGRGSFVISADVGTDERGFPQDVEDGVPQAYTVRNRFTRAVKYGLLNQGDMDEAIYFNIQGRTTGTATENFDAVGEPAYHADEQDILGFLINPPASCEQNIKDELAGKLRDSIEKSIAARKLSRLSQNFLDREGAMQVEVGSETNIGQLINETAALRSRHSFSHIAVASQDLNELIGTFMEFQKAQGKSIKTAADEELFLKAFYQRPDIRKRFDRCRELLTLAHRNGMQVLFVVNYPKEAEGAVDPEDDPVKCYFTALQQLIELPSRLHLTGFSHISHLDATDGVVVNIPNGVASVKGFSGVANSYQFGERKLYVQAEDDSRPATVVHRSAAEPAGQELLVPQAMTTRSDTPDGVVSALQFDRKRTQSEGRAPGIAILTRKQVELFEAQDQAANADDMTAHVRETATRTWLEATFAKNGRRRPTPVQMMVIYDYLGVRKLVPAQVGMLDPTAQAKWQTQQLTNPNNRAIIRLRTINDDPDEDALYTATRPIPPGMEVTTEGLETTFAGLTGKPVHYVGDVELLREGRTGGPHERRPEAYAAVDVYQGEVDADGNVTRESDPGQCIVMAPRGEAVARLTAEWRPGQPIDAEFGVTDGMECHRTVSFTFNGEKRTLHLQRDVDNNLTFWEGIRPVAPAVIRNGQIGNITLENGLIIRCSSTPERGRVTLDIWTEKQRQEESPDNGEHFIELWETNDQEAAARQVEWFRGDEGQRTISLPGMCPADPAAPRLAPDTSAEYPARTESMWRELLGWGVILIGIRTAINYFTNRVEQVHREVADWREAHKPAAEPVLYEIPGFGERTRNFIFTIAVTAIAVFGLLQVDGVQDLATSAAEAVRNNQHITAWGWVLLAAGLVPMALNLARSFVDWIGGSLRQRALGLVPGTKTLTHPLGVYTGWGKLLTWVSALGFAYNWATGWLALAVDKMSAIQPVQEAAQHFSASPEGVIAAALAFTVGIVAWFGFRAAGQGRLYEPAQHRFPQSVFGNLITAGLLGVFDSLSGARDRTFLPKFFRHAGIIGGFVFFALWCSGMTADQAMQTAQNVNIPEMLNAGIAYIGALISGNLLINGLPVLSWAAIKSGPQRILNNLMSRIGSQKMFGRLPDGALPGPLNPQTFRDTGETGLPAVTIGRIGQSLYWFLTGVVGSVSIASLTHYASNASQQLGRWGLVAVGAIATALLVSFAWQRVVKPARKWIGMQITKITGRGNIIGEAAAGIAGATRQYPSVPQFLGKEFYVPSSITQPNDVADYVDTFCQSLQNHTPGTNHLLEGLPQSAVGQFVGAAGSYTGRLRAGQEGGTSRTLMTQEAVNAFEAERCRLQTASDANRWLAAHWQHIQGFAGTLPIPANPNEYLPTLARSGQAGRQLACDLVRALAYNNMAVNIMVQMDSGAEFQDSSVGTALRDMIRDLRDNPNLEAIFPAIYVDPTLKRDSVHLGYEVAGTLVISLSQFIQYGLSMAFRATRRFEPGMNEVRATLAHIISDTDPNLVEFTREILGRWLRGHKFELTDILRGYIFGWGPNVGKLRSVQRQPGKLREVAEALYDQNRPIDERVAASYAAFPEFKNLLYLLGEQANATRLFLRNFNDRNDAGGGFNISDEAAFGGYADGPFDQGVWGFRFVEEARQVIVHSPYSFDVNDNGDVILGNTPGKYSCTYMPEEAVDAALSSNAPLANLRDILRSQVPKSYRAGLSMSALLMATADPFIDDATGTLQIRTRMPWTSVAHERIAAAQEELRHPAADATKDARDATVRAMIQASGGIPLRPARVQPAAPEATPPAPGTGATSAAFSAAGLDWGRISGLAAGADMLQDTSAATEDQRAQVRALVEKEILANQGKIKGNVIVKVAKADLGTTAIVIKKGDNYEVIINPVSFKNDLNFNHLLMVDLPHELDHVILDSQTPSVPTVAADGTIGSIPYEAEVRAQAYTLRNRLIPLLQSGTIEDPALQRKVNAYVLAISGTGDLEEAAKLTDPELAGGIEDFFREVDVRLSQLPKGSLSHVSLGLAASAAMTPGEAPEEPAAGPVSEETAEEVSAESARSREYVLGPDLGFHERRGFIGTLRDWLERVVDGLSLAFGEGMGPELVDRSISGIIRYGFSQLLYVAGRFVYTMHVPLIAGVLLWFGFGLWWLGIPLLLFDSFIINSVIRARITAPFWGWRATREDLLRYDYRPRHVMDLVERATGRLTLPPQNVLAGGDVTMIQFLETGLNTLKANPDLYEATVELGRGLSEQRFLSEPRTKEAVWEARYIRAIRNNFRHIPREDRLAVRYAMLHIIQGYRMAVEFPCALHPGTGQLSIDDRARLIDALHYGTAETADAVRLGPPNRTMFYFPSDEAHFDLPALIENPDVRNTVVGRSYSRSWAWVVIMYEAVRLSSRHYDTDAQTDPLTVALEILKEAKGLPSTGALNIPDETRQRMAAHDNPLDMVTQLYVDGSRLQPNMDDIVRFLANSVRERLWGEQAAEEAEVEEDEAARRLPRGLRLTYQARTSGMVYAPGQLERIPVLHGLTLRISRLLDRLGVFGQTLNRLLGLIAVLALGYYGCQWVYEMGDRFADWVSIQISNFGNFAADTVTRWFGAAPDWMRLEGTSQVADSSGLIIGLIAALFVGFIVFRMFKSVIYSRDGLGGKRTDMFADEWMNLNMPPGDGINAVSILPARLWIVRLLKPVIDTLDRLGVPVPNWPLYGWDAWVAARALGDDTSMLEGMYESMRYMLIVGALPPSVHWGIPGITKLNLWMRYMDKDRMPPFVLTIMERLANEAPGFRNISGFNILLGGLINSRALDKGITQAEDTRVTQVVKLRGTLMPSTPAVAVLKETLLSSNFDELRDRPSGLQASAAFAKGASMERSFHRMRGGLTSGQVVERLNSGAAGQQDVIAYFQDAANRLQATRREEARRGGSGGAGVYSYLFTHYSANDLSGKLSGIYADGEMDALMYFQMFACLDAEWGGAIARQMIQMHIDAGTLPAGTPIPQNATLADQGVRNLLLSAHGMVDPRAAASIVIAQAEEAAQADGLTLETDRPNTLTLGRLQGIMSGLQPVSDMSEAMSLTTLKVNELQMPSWTEGEIPGARMDYTPAYRHPTHRRLFKELGRRGIHSVVMLDSRIADGSQLTSRCQLGDPHYYQNAAAVRAGLIRTQADRTLMGAPAVPAAAARPAGTTLRDRARRITRRAFNISAGLATAGAAGLAAWKGWQIFQSGRAGGIPARKEEIPKTAKEVAAADVPQELGRIASAPLAQDGANFVRRQIITGQSLVTIGGLSAEQLVRYRKARGKDFRGLNFNGLPRSYAQNPTKWESDHLAQYGRVFIYDASLGIYNMLLTGQIDAASAGIDALVELGKDFEALGFPGGWLFSCNTSPDDQWMDPRAPMGGTMWALKAVYEHARIVLTSNDPAAAQYRQKALDNLAWANGFMERLLVDRGMQVIDKKDDRYGLMQAMVYNSQLGDRKLGYTPLKGDKYEVAPDVVFEHNADLADVLRLMSITMKIAEGVDGRFKGAKFNGQDFQQQMTWRHQILMEAISEKAWADDHFITALGNRSVAVDNETWVAQTLLPYEEDRVWQAVDYAWNNMATQCPIPDGTGRMRKVETYGDLIPILERVPARGKQWLLDHAGEPVVGLIFFDPKFKDPFAGAQNAEEERRFAQVMHPEGMAGMMMLLVDIACNTQDPARRKAALWRLEMINRSLEGLKNIYGGVGLPYATLHVKDLYNTLHSVASSASVSNANLVMARAAGGDTSTPFFLGVPAPAHFKVNGKAPRFIRRGPLTAAPAQPMTKDLESQAKQSRIMTDILRELSFAETISMTTPNISTRFTQATQKVAKITLLIGIPVNCTPEVQELVRQKLAALGRTDILVMPVDRYNMEYELKKLNCPYGVILDIDNTNNIDKLLEGFLDELDLQALYKEYNATKDTRRIVLDPRLLPTIKSLKLDYIMTHGIKTTDHRPTAVPRTRQHKTRGRGKTILTHMEIAVLEDKSKEVVMNG